MPKTPDRRPGIQYEDDAILFDDRGSDIPSDTRGLYRVSGELRGRDSVGVFNLRELFAADTHKAVRQLIHFIDEGPACGFASGAYKETLPSADPFPTSVIWWESSSKLKKIVEKTITRSGGGATNVTPTPIVWKMYDTDGTTVLCTVTDAITYSSVFEGSRERTIA